MLKAISWPDYFEALGITTIIYYGLILLKFYQAEVLALFSRKSSPVSQAAAAVPAFAENVEETAATIEDAEDETTSQIDALIGELKTCIAAAASKDTITPAVLLAQLKKIIHSYPDLAASPHRAAINELLVSECEKASVALLTEDEVDGWWAD
jgi:hypothetical protein